MYSKMATPGHEHESFLPEVEETDLLDLVFEEILDPEHREAWEAFAQDSPTLAREMLKRAYLAAKTTENISSVEIQKLILNEISFAFGAMRRAAQRRQEENAMVITMIDGVDASPQLSAVPDDDQPAA
jgi:hypothetical protein